MKRKVVIQISGGIPEVMEKPNDVEVEIRDFDTDGMCENELGDDGSKLTIDEATKEDPAPELLEALKAITAICEDEDMFPIHTEQAYKAINKAEGK